MHDQGSPVHVVLVYDVHTQGGGLGGVRLLPALLELLDELGGGVRPGGPEDPQPGEVEGQQLEPGDCGENRG